MRYLDDFPVFPLANSWDDTEVLAGRTKVYVVQTSLKVIERCLLMTTDPGDLVLDPTCGSGTTAYVAEQWGRRWITIDTSRVALALARTRLMTAKYPVLPPLRLSGGHQEGNGAERQDPGSVPRVEDPGCHPHSANGSISPEPGGFSPRAAAPSPDVRRGFVYRRVPHVTLKSIANNPDIHEGMTREEIDAAIARHADTELLYDKPYEDSKRIRVTGPFTVESLSPHRVLSTEDERPQAEADAERSPRAVPFETMILDNLRKAGVQNTRKNERLVFDRLEPFAGTWVHAHGEYTDSDRKLRRVAVSIGPEHGTVGPLHIREAAKEAVQGLGHDLLIVCGFAFDPHVTEEAKRYGGLTVLVTRMNPDLAMGDELLKKTGAGNLFMVFGEPDIEVQPVGAEGMLQVELKGLDIYDPTTGDVRSSSTDDVACWFIDTRLRRRELLRAPRLLHRRRRAVREAEARAAGRDRRGGLEHAVFDREPPVRPALNREDRRQGDQPLRGRSAEGLLSVEVASEPEVGWGCWPTDPDSEGSGSGTACSPGAQSLHASPAFQLAVPAT